MIIASFLMPSTSQNINTHSVLSLCTCFHSGQMKFLDSGPAEWTNLNVFNYLFTNSASLSIVGENELYYFEYVAMKCGVLHLPNGFKVIDFSNNDDIQQLYEWFISGRENEVSERMEQYIPNVYSALNHYRLIDEEELDVFLLWVKSTKA